MRYKISLTLAAMMLFLLGGHLSFENAWPFTPLWELRVQVYTAWQEQQLLQRLEKLGYRVEASEFAGRHDPLLLRVAERADAPLLLDLHPWNNTWLELREPLFARAAALDWHVIRPDFGGTVRNSGHCCSPAVIASIDNAIMLARSSGVPTDAPLLVLGESGGGMTAACWMSQGTQRAAHVQMWVPVTDMGVWQHQILPRDPELAHDIQQCTDNGENASALSPVALSYNDAVLSTVRMDIFAGIHDGFVGPVPVSHSVDLYNHLVQELSPAIATTAAVDPATTARLLIERRGDGGAYATLPPDRTVHLRRSAGNLSLTVFEGRHEMLLDTVFETFCRGAAFACVEVEQ